MNATGWNASPTRAEGQGIGSGFVVLELDQVGLGHKHDAGCSKTTGMAARGTFRVGRTSVRDLLTRLTKRLAVVRDVRGCAWAALTVW